VHTGYFLGPLLIVLGLMWAGWPRIPLPSFGFRAKRPTAAWGAFLLGIPFAIAVCPVRRRIRHSVGYLTFRHHDHGVRR